MCRSTSVDSVETWVLRLRWPYGSSPLVLTMIVVGTDTSGADRRGVRAVQRAHARAGCVSESASRKFVGAAYGTQDD